MRLQALTRLLSLSRHQAGGLVEIQRHAATQAASAEDRERYQQGINEYHKQRAAWKRQMTELRKQWLQEHRDAQHADKDAALKQREKELERRELARASAQPSEFDVQLQKLTRELEDAQLAYEVAVDKLKRAEREALRKQILREHESKRVEDLEEQSKYWITPDTLDAKINEILESPASLDPPPVPLESSQAA